MFGGIFEQVTYYRLANNRGNLWSDGLALDLIWIMCGWE